MLTLEEFFRKHLIFSYNFWIIPKSYFYETLQRKKKALSKEILHSLKKRNGMIISFLWGQRPVWKSVEDSPHYLYSFLQSHQSGDL